VQVGALTTWNNIDAGIGIRGHTVVTKTDGTLWAWGYNKFGQLGLGTYTPRSSPVQVGALTDWNIPGCGGYFSAAIKTDGTAWSWGINNYGQLGLDNRTYRYSPNQVGANTTWYKITCGFSNVLATTNL
jgi:alpha-tubulin suppressor-like RCC1 family protein